jgi:CubicO group peptidase (beta-lactamase class C family)
MNSTSSNSLSQTWIGQTKTFFELRTPANPRTCSPRSIRFFRTAPQTLRSITSWALLGFALLASGCGGGGGGGNSDTTVITPPQPTYPQHPTIWEEATPASVGINAEALSAALDVAMADGTFSQAVVVIKNGKLIAERYRGITTAEAESLAAQLIPEASYYLDQYGERDQESLVTSWSTAKSFTSFLIGIAVAQGHINSIDDAASQYISEWAADDRADITIKEILDMRSGLVVMCADPLTRASGECQTAATANSGGNLVFANDQMTPCIERPRAVAGQSYPWFVGGTVAYFNNAFQYSNCDTMILGEIVYRATGQDIQTYADNNLFSLIHMDAQWWRDQVEVGQANGNYLAYCCLDTTPRDFAKFGQMLIMGGIWDGSTQRYTDYTQAIQTLDAFYGLQFWRPCLEGTDENCSRSFISTIGFDGQYIMIDAAQELVIVRTSLYAAIENRSLDKKLFAAPADPSQSNWVASIPNGIGSGVPSTFNYKTLFTGVADAINP